ncbi:hypothetical protein B0H12DRAFT_1133420 [Mycena haematopus]|nr:hypothetical protein B0H12DRAFT_1133420 [Mycena haematopus]
MLLMFGKVAYSTLPLNNYLRGRWLWNSFCFKNKSDVVPLLSRPTYSSDMFNESADVATHARFNLEGMMEEGRASSSPSSGHTHEPTFEDGLRHSAQLEKGPKVKITLWRLLNTVFVLGLGIYKATATYRGQQVAATTSDWIVGVLWAVIAYWISFLEGAQLGPRGRWFFAQDHSRVVLRMLAFSLSFCAAGLLFYVFLRLYWNGFRIHPLWFAVFSLVCAWAATSPR